MYIPSRINQYFDGKCSDDEILYKADISRKQLREVLHLYDEYVSHLYSKRTRTNHSILLSYRHFYTRPEMTSATLYLVHLCYILLFADHRLVPNIYVKSRGDDVEVKQLDEGVIKT
jgi:hypothetical protein